jgi:glycosyltransferase involved in cell wall biosynthesis
LLYSLNRFYPKNSYILFTPKTKNRLILENDSDFSIVEPTAFQYKLFNKLWRRRYITKDIKNQKVDIYHGLSHELPIGIQRTGAKSVLTVHDLIFMRFPEFYGWTNSKIYRLKIEHSCRISDHIVAISRQTRDDIVEFLNIEPAKISVIYQGCNPIFRNDYSSETHQEVKKKNNLPERYLLFVGTIEERKNVLGIIKAIHQAKIDIPLVVIGRKKMPYFNKIQDYISSQQVSNIIFTEPIPNNDLPVFYQNAECFIYPSFFEGFGIPILEALVSKTPVITTRGGCFAEAAGPDSIYVDPGNIEEIAEAIQQVVNSRELRESMISKGIEYANRFKDEVIANEYMTLYHSMLK